MKYLYPKVIDTKVNTDNRGYLVETFKKKKINTDFKYSILVLSLIHISEPTRRM